MVNCNFVETMFLFVVHVGRWPDTTLWKTWYNRLWAMWGGGIFELVVKLFNLWSMWGVGQIQPCGKHRLIGCGQCGEVVNLN